MTSRQPTLVHRSLRLLLGLSLFALGTVLTLRASLGVPPWDVLHDGIRRNTPLSFGVAVIAIGVLLVLVSALFGMRPGPGTIANMLLIGAFEDLMLLTGIGADLGDAHLALRLLVSATGIAVVGLGSALYIGANLGAGPRDSLMVVAATKLGVRVGIARAFIEGSALLTGWLLGGAVGLGTLLFVAGIGPSVDVFFRLFGMEADGRRKTAGVQRTAI
ncbi:MAG: YitT family protein [Actinomycetota bacterium]